MNGKRVGETGVSPWWRQERSDVGTARFQSAGAKATSSEIPTPRTKTELKGFCHVLQFLQIYGIVP
ncbi:MAG: hypothetical protein Q7K44_00975 [Candidatus Liptonbacteria bacterium]|nr:hypothetical protein [Candidatus Liptonbacteria bacterium]